MQHVYIAITTTNSDDTAFVVFHSFFNDDQVMPIKYKYFSNYFGNDKPMDRKWL